MYVTLCNDYGKFTTEPIFFSEGIIKSKRDLKLHVKKVLGCEKVYSFKYSLDEFENQEIARFGDEEGHSIEIIQINTTDNGYIFSNPIREIKIISKYYFVNVPRFQEPETRTTITTGNLSEVKRIVQPSVEFQGLDKVLEELKEKLKDRNHDASDLETLL